MATGLETRFVTEFVFSFFLERNKPLTLKKMVNFNSSVVVSIWFAVAKSFIGKRMCRILAVLSAT